MDRDSTQFWVVEPAILRRGDILLDLRERKVTVGNRPPQQLTQIDCQLLKVFLYHPGEILNPGYLATAVWGDNYDRANNLRVRIRYLRRKIEADPSQPCYLKTVHGFGYRFDPC